ncbi:MAG: alkene reductase [Gammaproteobacteria bacterium]|nr:alkene reductase [Gammaproteobacteria bacterium]
MSKNILFDPVKIGDVDLDNRVVMAPMTRNRAENTIPGPINALYYEQRAGAGLIITEATQISPQGVGYPNTPGIHSREQIDGWKTVTQAVHKKDGRIFLQLWHVGRISHPSLQPDNALPVAPSALKPEGEVITYDGKKPYETPRALKTEEIPGIVEDYATAARNAIEAGFDGVEIHGANGYLIDQFLRSGANHRDDQYGGSVENRLRFLLEVTDAVIEAVGAGRTSVRLSPGGTFNSMHDDNPAETFSLAAKELGKRDLAYLHVVEDRSDLDDSFDFAQLKKDFGGLYMANQGYDDEDARRIIKNGHADLISFGKLFISNPDLVERLRKDVELACADPDTFYGGGAEGYVDYPDYSEKAA